MSLVARRRTEIVAAAGVGHRCATCGAAGRAGGGGWTGGPTGQESRPAAEKARRGSAGRASGGRVMLFVDPVGARAALGFEALDGIAGLLHSPGHEPWDDRISPPSRSEE